jgi:alkanesulfonate monooxygenase SsuD/methylene tetrahydromethanopterin reductase-like flavin-dependent oxidoreductase (luciferase family)
MGKMMLKISGEMTDGTLLWMTGDKTIEKHIAPTINEAASNANRPAPRVVAMNPVLVTDDIETAKKAAAEYFDRYGNLPSYRAMLDREGLVNSSEIAIIGNENYVTERLQDYANSGSTDFAASIFKTGKNDAENRARTKELLKNLVGKI